jgi:hypoxanthine phosphoribosyltransferase
MSVKIRSYSGAHTTGVIQETMGLTGDVKGRRIIIMEDIVDTGTTMAYLTDLLREKEARDVKICTMLFKPSQYKKSLKIDYVGRVVENKFILGFGLDYDDLGRQYKDIYVLDE